MTLPPLNPALIASFTLHGLAFAGFLAWETAPQPLSVSPPIFVNIIQENTAPERGQAAPPPPSEQSTEAAPEAKNPTPLPAPEPQPKTESTPQTEPVLAPEPEPTPALNAEPIKEILPTPQARITIAKLTQKPTPPKPIPSKKSTPQSPTQTAAKQPAKPAQTLKQSSSPSVQAEQANTQHSRTAPVQTARYQLGSVQNPLPPYPRLARKRGWQGKVLIAVHVDKKGQVGSLKLEQSSGHKSLDRAALKTLKSWRFTPATRLGQPVKSTIIVPILFQLEG